MRARIYSFFLVLILSVTALHGESLEGRIAAAVGNDDMGVAVITAWGDTVSVNGDKPYELQSVMKFYQALAMSRTMSAVELLNTKVTYGADDLKPDTWSPLRAVNSEGGTVDLSTLLYYSLRMSDNNAADILFDRFLSASGVDSVLKADTPAKNFAIARTEDEMHKNPSLAAENWSTPLDCAALFHYAFGGEQTESLAAIQAVMATKSAFGNSRIVKGVGNGTVFNKTGTGFENGDKLTAVNDAAFVYFPLSEGGFGQYSIAVFASDCRQDEAENKIAEISEIVWSYHIMRANEQMAAGINIPGVRNRPSGGTADSDDNVGQKILGAALLTAVVVDEIANRVSEHRGQDYNSSDSGKHNRSKSKSEGSRRTSQRRRPR